MNEKIKSSTNYNGTGSLCVCYLSISIVKVFKQGGH